MPLPPAQLVQERYVQTTSPTQDQFVIVSTMQTAVTPDQLPHLLVFVYQLVDLLSPKDDAFVRVATIGDLTTLPQGRNAALLAASGTGQLYLVQTVTLTYSTLTDAQIAAQAIRDRVNALITNWIGYQADFLAPPATPAIIYLPSVDPTAKQALINTYIAAKQAGYVQWQTKLAADAAVTAARTAVTTLQGYVTSLQGISTATLRVRGEVNTLVSGVSVADTVNVALSGRYVAGSSGYTGTNPNQLALNAGFVADVATLNSLVSTLLSALNAALSAAQAALSSALTAQANQVALLYQADTATYVALNALLTVAPDYNPLIVPYVPDAGIADPTGHPYNGKSSPV